MPNTRLLQPTSIGLLIIVTVLYGNKGRIFIFSTKQLLKYMKKNFILRYLDGYDEVLMNCQNSEQKNRMVFLILIQNTAIVKKYWDINTSESLFRWKKLRYFLTKQEIISVSEKRQVKQRGLQHTAK